MIYVVISGASRGIGKALAKEYAKHKYGLILNCEKNFDLLVELKQFLINEYNMDETGIHIKKGNFTEDYLEKIITKNDSIYLLINNASKDKYGLLQDISLEDWNDVINSNLTDAFINTKSCLKYFLKSKEGNILNISSMWGILGASNEVLYSTTKGGINAFTKSLAKELAPSNINVFAVALGCVDTDMNNNLSIEEKKELCKTLDNNKMFTPKEIAEQIYSLILNNKINSGEIFELNNGLQ